MREAAVEKEFVKAVRETGGMALKLTSQTMNGMPDRLVLLPGGKAAFVELKAPGKMMRPLQRKRRNQLLMLGFPALCVDRPEQIREVVRALEEWVPGKPIPEGVGARIPELARAELPEHGCDDTGRRSDDAWLSREDTRHRSDDTIHQFANIEHTGAYEHTEGGDAQ